MVPQFQRQNPGSIRSSMETRNPRQQSSSGDEKRRGGSHPNHRKPVRRQIAPPPGPSAGVSRILRAPGGGEGGGRRRGINVFQGNFHEPASPVTRREWKSTRCAGREGHGILVFTWRRRRRTNECDARGRTWTEPTKIVVFS